MYQVKKNELTGYRLPTEREKKENSRIYDERAGKGEAFHIDRNGIMRGGRSLPVYHPGYGIFGFATWAEYCLGNHGTCFYDGIFDFVKENAMEPEIYGKYPYRKFSGNGL